MTLDRQSALSALSGASALAVLMWNVNRSLPGRPSSFMMENVESHMDAEFQTRRAHPSDVDDIALAHRDSIRSIGPAYYPESVVDDWGAGLAGDVYLKAMDGGEVFFIATASVDGRTLVLGFASDYRIEGSAHGTSVYVRGLAARRGIGSALLGLAEAHAIANGATSIKVEASLAGVEFYKANGFVEAGRGETRLMSGRPIACVFMRKMLVPSSESSASNRIIPEASEQ